MYKIEKITFKGHRGSYRRYLCSDGVERTKPEIAADFGVNLNTLTTRLYRAEAGGDPDYSAAWIYGPPIPHGYKYDGMACREEEAGNDAWRALGGGPR